MDIKNRLLNSLTLDIVIRYIVFIIFGLCISIFLLLDIWADNPFLAHGLFELICIFISLVIFFIILITSKYKYGNMNYATLGVGFLCVATYDFFHVITYPLGFYPEDISLVFWLLARFIEGSFLFISTFNINSKYTVKRLIIFIYLPLYLLSLFIFSKGVFFIPLFTNNGLTNYKIFAEVIIIALYCVTIYRIVTNNKIKNIMNQLSTILSIILLVTAEICLTLFDQPITIYVMLAHTLKVVAYLYLFKSVYTVTVETPYNELFDTKLELEQILNGLPIGLLNIDKNNRIVFANDILINNLQCNLDDIKGLPYNELYAKFEIQKIKQKTFTNEWDNSIDKYNFPDGKSLTLHRTSYNYKHGTIYTFSDAISEEEMTDFKLQTSIILNNIINHVILFDKDKKIINYNNSAKDFYSLDSDTFIGLAFEELQVKLQLNIADSLYSIDDIVNATVVTQEGSKDILYHFSIMQNINNQVLGYIFVSTDVTLYKEREEQIKQQEKMALIGEMGSGIVHEAKNYLAVINGYCDLLSLQLKNQQNISSASKIKSAANDLNKVITEFLALAKPKETILDIISLNEIILSLDYLFNNSSFLHNSAIELNLMNSDMDILGDESQIKQVILNFIKNAIDAMDGRPNSVLKIITKFNEDTKSMEVLIIDNGKGISQENLDKLGTPFFTTKKYGTGLGLSICYRMIEELGGYISVKSTLGEGTTFIISLPIYEEEYNLNSDDDYFSYDLI